MAHRQFVIAEYPQEDTPLSAFTAKHRDCSIDLISEPAVLEGGERVHPALVLVKGIRPPELESLLAILRRVYRVETMERNDAQNWWLGRLRLPESVYDHNPGAHVITQFQHRFGAPWCHLEQGQMHVRARVNDEGSGELLADQMRRFFAKAGVEAQVELREISAKDYGVWEDLVQRAIGLAP